MDLLTLFLLAVGLSMDAFAVSISNGMSYANYRKKEVIMAAVAFGLFQGLMPAFGFVGGRAFADLIMAVDHWLALILLGFIGGKMVVESIEELRNPSDEPQETGKTFTMKLLVMQAIATSIDALAVGITFALLPDFNILAAVLFIGVITFAFSATGVKLGSVFGGKYKSKAEFTGGAILVVLGIKILVEHLDVFNKI